MTLREEVLELFAEAQRIGHRFRRRWEAEVEYGRVRLGLPGNAPQAPEPVLAVGVERGVCGRCGGVVEHRSGNPRAIHMGGGCGAGWVVG